MRMPFNWAFFKIDHYCGGFERKMRRVVLILTKLSFGKDFKELSGRFVQFCKLVNKTMTYCTGKK